MFDFQLLIVSYPHYYHSGVWLAWWMYSEITSPGGVLGGSWADSLIDSIGVWVSTLVELTHAFCMEGGRLPREEADLVRVSWLDTGRAEWVIWGTGGIRGIRSDILKSTSPLPLLPTSPSWCGPSGIDCLRDFLLARRVITCSDEWNRLSMWLTCCDLSYR